MIKTTSLGKCKESTALAHTLVSVSSSSCSHFAFHHKYSRIQRTGTLRYFTANFHVFVDPKIMTFKKCQLVCPSQPVFDK